MFVIATILLCMLTSLGSLQAAEKTKEVKHGYTVHLCGVNFVKAWNTVCRWKVNKSPVGATRVKRSITGNNLNKFVVLRVLKVCNKEMYLHI